MYINIELYDARLLYGDDLEYSKAVVLFHESDEPYWKLGAKLEEMVQKAQSELCSDGKWYRWKGQVVGALLIKYASEDISFQTDCVRIPAPFEPHLDPHGFSAYVWRIFLGTHLGESDIRCYRLEQEGNVLTSLEPVDWRREAKAQENR